MTPSHIPITILTGFLGAGKTTLLNTILQGQHGLRVAVLVNDFGAINVDASLIVGVQGETVSLANGCICCTIRGDLQQSVEALLARPERPEYILIEASGVSDPAQIALTFTRTVLREQVRIDSILAVVDAEQFDTLPRDQHLLARDQLRVADIVILNKTDLVSAAERARLRDWIRGFVPQARIIETHHARVPLELILGVGQYDPARLAAASQAAEVHVHDASAAHDHPHDHSLMFSTWSWQTPAPLHLQALYAALEALPLSVYRMKGTLYVREMPERRCILQVAGKRAAITQGDAWGDTVPFTAIALIGDHDSLDAAALEQQFAACLADAPASTEQPFIAGIWRWLRGERSALDKQR